MKRDFISDYTNNGAPVTKMVVAVQLPTDAVELIINSEDIAGKFEYYCNAYDDDMRLKNNSAIQIIRWFFV